MKEFLCELPTQQGPAVLPFRLRRSSRHRSLRVSVRDTGEVILSVPWYVSDSGALDFMRSQAEWLMQTLGKVRHQHDIYDHLLQEPWLSLDGHRAHVMLDESKIRTQWVADPERGETIIRYFIGTDNRSVELMGALMEMARCYVPQRTKELAGRLGVRIGRIQVRDQRTRWGSCTSEGNLSFNWRIILLPPPLHDHIILHELAHVTHLNHSASFHKLLAAYDPKSEEHDHSISKLSPLFMSLGR